MQTQLSALWGIKKMWGWGASFPKEEARQTRTNQAKLEVINQWQNKSFLFFFNTSKEVSISAICKFISILLKCHIHFTDEMGAGGAPSHSLATFQGRQCLFTPRALRSSGSSDDTFLWKHPKPPASCRQKVPSKLHLHP